MRDHDGALEGSSATANGGSETPPQPDPGSYARQPRPLPALPLHLPLQLLTAVRCAATISSEPNVCIANDHVGLLVYTSVDSQLYLFNTEYRLIENA